MPYIKTERRPAIDEGGLDAVLLTLAARNSEKQLGDAAYIIARVAGTLLRTDISYARMAAVDGVLGTSQDEFRRRIVAIKEWNAVMENGDVPEYADIVQRLHA